MKDKLRRQAEELAKVNGSANKPPPTPEEMRQSLHELRVHQIELELQNDELRRTQAELDATRERYFDLYNLAPVGYCTVSEQGLILEANLTAATQLGLARSEMVGQPLTRFIHRNDQDIYYRHRLHLFKGNKAAKPFELRMVKKDGGMFWTNLTATIAQDAEGKPVARIVLLDITERKQEEQNHEDIQRIIQHDIKGPLINLHSLTQLVMTGKEHKSLLHIFPQILLGIRQVIHLIDAAEPLRAMEKGEYTPVPKPVDISRILKEVQDALAMLSSQNKNAIVLQTATSSHSSDEHPHGEAFLFEDMFMNLVKNALEASPKGAPVTITSETLPGAVHVAIHNKGAVPESIRDHFFEKYTTSGKPYGTGLGTYSARLIAGAHGGRIGFTSSEAEGTTVTVRLPCRGGE